MIEIKVKKLDENAVIPKLSHPSDAGFDCTATSFSVINDEVYHYGIGLAFSIPEGYWMDIRPRSSVFRTGMILANSIGTIDGGYRGEVQANFYKVANGEPYMVGDRICQIVIPNADPRNVRFVEVDELDDSDRGAGGFGSTGK